MIIIYISHLSTNVAAGLNWSVPMSVKAQQLYDDVLWINTTSVVMNHWNDVEAYHNLEEFGGILTLKCLPTKYQHPNLVVFEGLYFKEYVSFSKELLKESIPYIIVPRSSLTYKALHNHARIKKWIAHLLYFNKFIKKAWRIQYLTQNEAADSIRKYKINYFVLPNGVCSPQKVKTAFSPNQIKAVFIGRLDMYQKGLDMLLSAIDSCKVELRRANFTLSIYGPHRYDYLKIGPKINEFGINDIVSVHDEVSGIIKSNILMEADLFVLTSRFEGHPMGLLEALAYGIPCLITKGSNMYDEVKMFDAGWVCDDYTESIKDGLMEIVDNRNCFSSKSKNAKRLSQEYDWNKISSRFHDIIQKASYNYNL